MLGKRYCALLLEIFLTGPINERCVTWVVQSITVEPKAGARHCSRVKKRHCFHGPWSKPLITENPSICGA